jgi:hypothetical protein
VYELSLIEDYNIYKDYLPLYTTVSLNVFKKYLNNSVYTVIKLPVEKRICPLWNIEPEDAIHFILKCPKLDECRKDAQQCHSMYIKIFKYFCIYCNNNFA